jgi:long-subunit fatty acid transport protein
MKLKVPYSSSDDPAWYDPHNEYIKEDHRSASTVKAGLECRFTPQFSGRLGYAWMQNPYNSEGGLVKFGEPYIDNSNTIFRIEGDTQYFTGGFGYRFSRNLYFDLAVVYKTQKDDLYPFPNFYEDGKRVIDATPFPIKNNSIRGLLTLGYKF